MANLIAEPLNQSQRIDLHGLIARGLARIALKSDAASSSDSEPADLVKRADDFVEHEQIEREKYLKGIWLIFVSNPEAIGAEVGAVWGTQVCRAANWRWASVTRGKKPELAIASPDDRLLIFAASFVRRMVLPPYDDNTLMLTFNMITAGKLPEAAPGALEDITGAARHIVPKRDRPRYRGG